MIPALRGETPAEDRVLVAAMLRLDGWTAGGNAIIADLLDHCVTTSVWERFGQLCTVLDDYVGTQVMAELLDADPDGYVDKHADYPPAVERVVWVEHEHQSLATDLHASWVRARDLTRQIAPAS